MRYFQPTSIAIVAIIAAITGYDVWAFVGGYNHTISWTLGTVAHDWPIIPYVFGVFTGHLFFPGRNGYDNPETKP